MPAPSGQGLAGVVQKRLEQRLDPIAAFAALQLESRGERALFEGKDGLTLLMQDAAVRAECRGEQVTLRSLSANGESLLAAVQSEFAEWLVASEAAVLTLRFPSNQSLCADERLLAASPLHALRTLLKCLLPGCPDGFGAALIGVVAFDYAALGEDLPDNPEDPLGFPDYVFWVPETLLLIHESGRARVLCAAFPDEDPALAARNYHDAVSRLARLDEACRKPMSAVTPAGRKAPSNETADLSDEEYAQVVGRMKEEIAAGEIYQVVPSRTFRAPCHDPLRAYAALRALEPDSYRFFIDGDGFQLFGASPETSVRIENGGGVPQVEVRPIAGTRPRGETLDEDNRIEVEMRLDEKELAEHMMLVDLARNDVARICVPGSRRVARLLTVERYARVMHLVSSVTGQLAPGFDALHALEACLNMGTLTGAPKIRATGLLRRTERTRRGPYGGAVGWLNAAGLMDTAVVIRSAFVRDGTAHVRAGAGIVHDSDPFSEAEETRRKASALLSILGEGASL